MMAGNPTWWGMIMNGGNMNSLSISDHNTFSLATNLSNQADQDFPLKSWSQLLMGGGEEEQLRFDLANLFQQQKKFENWEEEVLNLNNTPSFSTNQEAGQSNNYGYVNENLNFCAARKNAGQWKRNRQQYNDDHSYERKSSGNGGVSKKARVQHDHELSPQPVLKVRKEKVMDRVTALHRLVSPFGKNDTASVLSEAIVTIRFLQAQIESFSSPYMWNASVMVHHQYSDSQRSEVKDLQSRGLCLVPVSNCTQQFHIDNGDDCWGPAALGGGF